MTKNMPATRLPYLLRQLRSAALKGCNIYIPKQCLLCAQVILTASADHLCPHCRLALPFNLNPCRHCALPLASSEERTSICAQCLTKPLANRAVAPLVHRQGAAFLVHRMKFYRAEPEARALATMMATQIRLTEMSRLPNVLIPVPIAYTTAVQRTFNQSALLAWHLAKTFNIAYAPRLLMRQGGPAQRSLSRGQRLASTGFACRQNAANLAGKHVAIVDDVLTTGATARKISQLLRGLGADLIDVWCATRTPTEDS